MSQNTRLRFAVFALAIAALVALSLVLPLDRWVLRAADWIRAAGALGVVTYVGLYIAGTLLFAPGSILTLAAGFAYGPLAGTVLVLPTATVAALLAFVVARFVARDWVNAKVERHPRFAAVDRAVARAGFRIVLLLRLSPLFPYNFLNYALGLTGVSLAKYALASFVGMLPGTAMYVYLGSLVTRASELAGGVDSEVARSAEGGGSASAARSALYWGGLAATVLATVLITRYARRELRAELDGAKDGDE
jgi:uncharacterized membrane protein YdjX (TVP38/TMEM64 family)